MHSTLDKQFISEYCTRFTDRVIASLKDKSIVSGKELINLTPSKQVNFFILKVLYGRWQDEMKKLESPYFNYKHEEVRQALTNYMNVLSQNIEVKQDDLEPLLKEAIEKAIYWVFTPADALKEEVEQKHIKQVSGLKVLTRYFKVYQDDLSYLITEKEDASIDEFISEWKGLMDQKSTDSVIEKELALLSEIEEITPEQCTVQDEIEEEELIEEQENEREPEEVVDNDTDSAGSDSEVDIKAEADADDEGSESDQETFYESEAGDNEEENLDESSEEKDLKNEDGTLEDEELLVESEDSLNKKFEKDQETLHDQYKEDQVSVATKHQQKKISSILEAVSVNQEFMFTSELFGGEKGVFQESVEKIESCSSFDESVELLVSTYSEKYGWDMNSVEVKELLKVVFRRFR